MVFIGSILTRDLRRNLKLGLVLGLWVAALGAGFLLLIRYQQTPGPPALARKRLPPEWGLPAQPGRPVLVMALHPRCPCSRASVSELGRILSRAPNACEVCILLYKPAGEPDAWVEGPLPDEVRLQGGSIRIDADGSMAGRLGATTSGQVMLYDAAGLLCFEGGITASRGHRGDSLGGGVLTRLLRGETTDKSGSPVFGCSIQGYP